MTEHEETSKLPLPPGVVISYLESPAEVITGQAYHRESCSGIVTGKVRSYTAHVSHTLWYDLICVGRPWGCPTCQPEDVSAVEDAVYLMRRVDRILRGDL